MTAEHAVPLSSGGQTTAMHYPAAAAAAARGSLVLLAHGAGAGQRHPFIVAYGTELASRGVDVVTFNFPYTEARRKVPDKAPVLEACFRDVIAHARRQPGLGGSRLFLAGKSMGGRMATHLAAQGEPGVGGVIALGYPLHPPGKPDQPRTAHLPSITVAVLIVQGERDAFGTPAELQPVIATMTAPTTLHTVTGGDHSLAVRGTPGEQIRRSVCDAVLAWMNGVPAK